MLSDILSSVRWEQFGVTIGFMAFVFILHFAWWRPLQRNAQAEAQKFKLDRQTIELSIAIQRVTGDLTRSLLAPINSEQLAVHGSKLQAAMSQVSGPPVLLQAMQDLLDTTAKLAATGHAEKLVEFEALQLATACLAVEQRLPTLVRVASTKCDDLVK